MPRVLFSSLDRKVKACKFLVPDLEVDLWHLRSISSLCMLYKIFHNPDHPLNSELPNLFQPARITRNALKSNSLAFSIQRNNTGQYSRCFIPAPTALWNKLPVVLLSLVNFKNSRPVLIYSNWDITCNPLVLQYIYLILL